MRPDPTERHEHDPSGRIIYLGDVRRRKGSQRQSPDRHYLAAIGLAALAAWAIWAVVLFSLAPSKLLTYIAFLAPLAIALAATGTLGAYAFEHRRHQYATLRPAFRRGFSLSGVTIINLSFLAAHHWSVIVFAVSALAAVIAEVVALRRN